jgi:hypothetical protein
MDLEAPDELGVLSAPIYWMTLPGCASYLTYSQTLRGPLLLFRNIILLDEAPGSPASAAAVIGLVSHLTRSLHLISPHHSLRPRNAHVVVKYLVDSFSQLNELSSRLQVVLSPGVPIRFFAPIM